MRQFQTLDKMTVDAESGILYITTEHDSGTYPMIAMRREGVYIAISASYGPLEIALRPRAEELARLLARLQPVKGLQTTRQIGTVNAYLAVGLRVDETLVMRPTLVADATGHLSFNLALSPAVRQGLFDWLPVIKAQA